MNKKIAIIGASYLQVPLLLKAKSMGLETHCFAWEDGAVGKDLSDFFYPISILEISDVTSMSSVADPASGEFADNVIVLPFNVILRARDFPSEIVETRSMALVNSFGLTSITLSFPVGITRV